MSILFEFITNEVRKSAHRLLKITEPFVGFDLKEVLEEAVKKKMAKRDAAISLTYLSTMRRKNISAKFMLFLTLFLSANVLIFGEYKESVLFVIASTVALFFISLKEYIVELRIRKGIFGTTQYEAKELIDFLIRNSKDIDFHDDQGNLKKMFLSEASVARNNERPNAHGAKTQ